MTTPIELAKQHINAARGDSTVRRAMFEIVDQLRASQVYYPTGEQTLVGSAGELVNTSYVHVINSGFGGFTVTLPQGTREGHMLMARMSTDVGDVTIDGAGTVVSDTDVVLADVGDAVIYRWDEVTNLWSILHRINYADGGATAPATA